MRSAGSEKRGLRLGHDIVVPEAELEVRASRSGGPGGQNVNKVETRIELRFDLAGSAVFDAATKQRLRERLGKRVSEDGVVRVVAQMHRSRARNEAEARARLVALLQRALAAPRPRRPTRPTQASRQRRLDAKRQRAASKRARRVDED